MSCEYVVQRTAANLPQSSTETLFTVEGGNVLVTGLVGTVTTSIQAQSTSIILSLDVSEDVIVASPDINGYVAGTLIGGTGSAPDAVKPALYDAPFVLAEGCQVSLQCTAASTGQVRWTLWYKSLDAGAYVEAS